MQNIQKVHFPIHWATSKTGYHPSATIVLFCFTIYFCVFFVYSKRMTSEICYAIKIITSKKKRPVCKQAAHTHTSFPGKSGRIQPPAQLARLLPPLAKHRSLTHTNTQTLIALVCLSSFVYRLTCSPSVKIIWPFAWLKFVLLELFGSKSYFCTYVFNSHFTAWHFSYSLIKVKLLNCQAIHSFKSWSCKSSLAPSVKTLFAATIEVSGNNSTDWTGLNLQQYNFD